ncbi:MAG: glycosyltransferase family 39 protein [Chloroflexota bacterium]|nr:glycosyltransferase family 39 protein [Chloroflexota bacterium]
MLLLILGTALALRVYGIAWDGGYLFHPDERQIMFVVDALSFPWPPDWSVLLSPESPWNPHFFAYGSFPIYLLRIATGIVAQFKGDFRVLRQGYLLGRALSALFDVGTVYLTYRLGRKLYGKAVGLLSGGLLACAVLHIQLSHFYTVDTLLVFFVVWTVSLCVDLSRLPSWSIALPLGSVYGLALATKVSAAPLMVPISLAWVFVALRHSENVEGEVWRGRGRWFKALGGLVLTSVIALVVFVFCEPYAVLDIRSFLVDIMEEGYMARVGAGIPYTKQYIGTRAYVYPLRQTVVWAVGVPLGIAGFGGALAVLGKTVKEIAKGQWACAAEGFLPLSWGLVYFGIVGSFHTKFLRYMLPIIPFLCMWAAWLLVSVLRVPGIRRRIRNAVGVGVFILVLVPTVLYALAFMNVYRETHPWIQETAWLCRNVPPGSQIMVEHWDDPLPLVQGQGDLDCHGDYRISVFPAYHVDDEEKLATLLYRLETSDYIVLSTNRLYNTIPRLPDRYPLTSRYYELLLGEELGYELVHYVAVYPRLFGANLMNDTFSDPDLPKPHLLAQQETARCSLNLGRADESFTVYDHPKPLIFKNTGHLSREALLAQFGDIVEEFSEDAGE